ncbi:hypothetical protein QTO34_013852 [Cnephaeus nilssonii]|uniref:Ras-GEF domain-containing protein n=1 Tax=Cnephaeus nilssonii TaxID=3371016 RepID=A0AA40I8P2_CNENI|nr:hypothetical protein QTO34_013852 [Eptesicus nilssonii]
MQEVSCGSPCWLVRIIVTTVLESAPVERAAVQSSPAVDATELSPGRSPSTPRHLRYRQPGGQMADSSHCSVSPASAFAIATAAAGHGSPPGFNNTDRICDKEFIIRRTATNRVLNVLRHWVSKHAQRSQGRLHLLQHVMPGYVLTPGSQPGSEAIASKWRGDDGERRMGLHSGQTALGITSHFHSREDSEVSDGSAVGSLFSPSRILYAPEHSGTLEALLRTMAGRAHSSGPAPASNHPSPLLYWFFVTRTLIALTQDDQDDIHLKLEDIIQLTDCPKAECFETLPAMELAEQITLLDHIVFRSIPYEGSAAQPQAGLMAVSDDGLAIHPLAQAQNLKILLDPFSPLPIPTTVPNMSNLVASQIMNYADISSRANAIEKWVAVADICRCLHNYNGMLEITSALNRTAIYRLKKTWAKVSKQISHIVREIRQFQQTSYRIDHQPKVTQYLLDKALIIDEDTLKAVMTGHWMRLPGAESQTPFYIHSWATSGRAETSLSLFSRLQVNTPVQRDNRCFAMGYMEKNQKP